MRNDGTVHPGLCCNRDNLNGDQTTGTLGGREAGAGD
ncbi:MAG: hypothetical protein CM15mP44_2450 [Candidatus Neomarinimicrobiota bacterium]|nr:MAG: hypothetical protein CM15mP44_2450 [Candidatus Neomarinimicrobiota bacterium]